MQAPQPLPMSLQQFVHQQPTLLSEHLVDPTETRQYPYGTYWWRAIAGILLAGRAKPRHDRSPNMTDVNRLCKEANFNQYLFERMTKFLVNAQIIDVSKGQREYVPGERIGSLKHFSRERPTRAATIPCWRCRALQALSCPPARCDSRARAARSQAEHGAERLWLVLDRRRRMRRRRSTCRTSNWHSVRSAVLPPITRQQADAAAPGP